MTLSNLRTHATWTCLRLLDASFIARKFCVPYYFTLLHVCIHTSIGARNSSTYLLPHSHPLCSGSVADFTSRASNEHTHSLNDHILSGSHRFHPQETALAFTQGHQSINQKGRHTLKDVACLQYNCIYDATPGCRL